MVDMSFNHLLPRFATDSGSADVTEPSSAKKDVGWLGRGTPDRPAAQHMNWLARQNYEWHKRLKHLLKYRSSDSWKAQNVPSIHTEADNTIRVTDVLPIPSLGIVVACGYSSNGGTIWTAETAPTSWTNYYSSGVAGIRGLAFDGTTIIGVGGQGATQNAQSSTDGVSWTNETTHLGSSTSACKSVSWDDTNSLWITTNTTQILTTPDATATSWTVRRTLNFNVNEKLDTNPSTGKTIVVSSANILAQSSTNGTTYSDLSITAGNPSAFYDVVYANVGGTHTWVISGTSADTPNVTAYWYSTDDGSTWNIMRPANDYPFLRTVGSAAAYSDSLGYWIFAEHDGVGASTGVDLWAGELGDPTSFRRMNTDFPIKTFHHSILSLAWSGVFAETRRQEYWLAGLDAFDDQAMLLSAYPVT